jgi:hypothetical protein
MSSSMGLSDTDRHVLIGWLANDSVVGVVELGDDGFGVRECWELRGVDDGGKDRVGDGVLRDQMLLMRTDLYVGLYGVR